MIDTRIKYLATINKHQLPENTPPDFAFCYIDIGAVSDTGDIAIPDELVTFASAPSRARRLAPEGAVVVSTVRTYLRAIARVPASEDPLIFSTGFAVLEARPLVDPQYLYYLCRSDLVIGEVVARSTGVSYPAIDASRLGDIPVTAPSVEQQRRVADFLDDQVKRMNRALELRQRERQLVREQRDAVITSYVSGADYESRLPSGLPWLDLIPPHWATPKITHLARLGSGHTPSRNRPEWWDDCTVPWITTGEVAALRDDNIEDITETREKLSLLGIENSSAEIHPAGTVVLSRTASAGYSGVMATEMCTSQDFVTWTCGPRLYPYWLLWCLRAMRPDLLGRLAMGSTFKTIYVPDIQTLRIPLPPLEEQHKRVDDIRRVIDEARRRTALIDRGIALLEERKQALITAAVTGQFDITTARAVA